MTTTKAKSDSRSVRALTPEEIAAAIAKIDGVCCWRCPGRISHEVHYRYNGPAGRAVHVRRKVCEGHAEVFARRHGLPSVKPETQEGRQP